MFTSSFNLGNLFTGYDTTANAIIYGLITLALHEDLQTQMIEEIDQIYNEAANEGRQEPTYTEDFNKLQFTYGFMVSRLINSILEPSTNFADKKTV